MAKKEFEKKRIEKPYIAEMECSECHNVYDIKVDEDDYMNWCMANFGDWGQYTPEKIPATEQFAYVEPQWREMFISGICPNCWKKMFGSMEESRKTRKTEKKLTEGPGAGYTIAGIITNVKINGYDYTINEEDDTIEVNGDIDCVIDDMSFYSYFYGDENYKAKAKIKYIVFYDCDIANNDYTESDIDEMIRYISGTEFEIVYGGGYSHATFEGDLDIDYMNNDYSYGADIYIDLTDEEDIQYIDDSVTGNFETFSEEDYF